MNRAARTRTRDVKQGTSVVYRRDTEKPADDIFARDERDRLSLSLQTPRTTTATGTRPPTRRSRAAGAAAVVRRAAPTWPVARLWRPPEPAAVPARPRRPEAPARSRTTPPRRRISTWLDGRATTARGKGCRRSVRQQT